MHKDGESMDNLKQLLEECMDTEPSLSTTEAVYSVLLNQIISFDIPPKTKLVLSHLAVDFGISMTPVRDAVIMLAENKLVEINASKKAIVTDYDENLSQNLFQFRQALESCAAAQACTQASGETIAHLAEVMEKNTELYYEAKSSQDPELINKLVNEDLFFHRALVKASGNRYVIEQYDRIYPSIVFMRKFFSPFDFNPVEYPEAHRAITSALQTRSVEFVRGAVSVHFRALDSAKRFE